MLLDRFEDWCRRSGLKPDTARDYRDVVTRIASAFGRAPETLGEDHLRAYQQVRYSEGRQLQSQEYYGLKKFFQFLRSERIRTEEPSPWEVLDRPNPRKGQVVSPPPLREGVSKALQNAPERARKLAVLIYETGLEPAQIRSLLRSRQRILGASEATVPSRAGYRTVNLTPRAWSMIDALKDSLPGSNRTIIKDFQKVGTTATRIKELSVEDRQRAKQDISVALFSLLLEHPELYDVEHAYREALYSLDRDLFTSAIIQAGTALHEMLRAMGGEGNTLGDLFRSVRRGKVLAPYDEKLIEALELITEWVNAARSTRGSSHLVHRPTIDDAWLSVRVTAAVLVRLIPMMKPR